MGYYGYTYGGPPTGQYANSNMAAGYQDTDIDLIQEQAQVNKIEQVLRVRAK